MHSLDLPEIRSHINHHLFIYSCDRNNVFVADVILQFQSIGICQWICVPGRSGKKSKSFKCCFGQNLNSLCLVLFLDFE